MVRLPVFSSLLCSVGYSDNVLEIELEDGKIYQYFFVLQSLYEDLMSAESKGQFFNRNIKKACIPFQRIQ